jgi:hypothetical protein
MYLLEITSYYRVCQEKCSKYLDNCDHCSAVYDTHGTVFRKCQKCSDGYYINFFTGFCEPCSTDASCTSCS